METANQNKEPKTAYTPALEGRPSTHIAKLPQFLIVKEADLIKFIYRVGNNTRLGTVFSKIAPTIPQAQVLGLTDPNSPEKTYLSPQTTVANSTPAITWQDYENTLSTEQHESVNHSMAIDHIIKLCANQNGISTHIPHDLHIALLYLSIDPENSDNPNLFLIPRDAIAWQDRILIIKERDSHTAQFVFKLPPNEPIQDTLKTIAQKRNTTSDCLVLQEHVDSTPISPDWTIGHSSCPTTLGDYYPEYTVSPQNGFIAAIHNSFGQNADRLGDIPLTVLYLSIRPAPALKPSSEPPKISEQPPSRRKPF